MANTVIRNTIFRPSHRTNVSLMIVSFARAIHLTRAAETSTFAGFPVLAPASIFE
jgi:hypothetical protein